MEDLLRQILCGASTVTFYAVAPAHLTLLPLLACGELPHFPIRKGPLFILDKTAHASIQINRGLMSQFGKIVRVDFNDIEAIEKTARSAAEKGLTPITISDGVGSMGGLAPVNALLTIAQNYDGYAYLDDAHGISAFGRRGSGYVLDALGDIFPPRLLLFGSLSKAFGAHGGFFASAFSDTADFVKHYGMAYAFGSPPCLPGIAACVAAAQLHLNGEVERRQTVLHERLALFDRLFAGHL